MDSEAEQELKRILALDPGVLNPAEIGFLKARLSYLTTDQKRIFASVLEAKAEKPKKK
jgi:hypothetical protein